MMKHIIDWYVKVHTGNINQFYSILTVSLILTVYALTIRAQGTREFPDTYCENETGKEIKDASRNLNSVYLEYSQEKNTTLIFKIYNTTNDTKYLFSSYFHPSYYSAKCIHRLNSDDKSYKISFIPIVPFLGTRTEHVKILSSEKICKPFQMRYNFIKLLPNTFYELKIEREYLFKGISLKSQVTKDFDVKDLDKFDTQYIFPPCDINRLDESYDLVFEFGMYSDVNLLCDEFAYYTKEFDFNKQAKSFQVLSTKVKLSEFYDLLK